MPQWGRLSRVRLLAGLGFAVVLVAGVHFSFSELKAAGFVGPNKTYTLDADFDLGVLFNVNHDAPNNNQLQLNETLTTFPVMWIANAGEDTVSKIDTNTGRELARYRTGFGPAGQPGYQPHLGNAYAGPAPSRTGVNTDGHLYIANRRFDNRPADVLKILSEGGIDRNGNGTIDTSSDLDNNGVISGAEILPMGDTNGNGIIEISEVQDERVVWVQRVGAASQLGRSLCLDTNGDPWLGTYQSPPQYYKLDAATGMVIAGPILTNGVNNYGCLVDSDGYLWGASLGGFLVKLDTNTNSLVNTYNHGAFGTDYGIALGNGRVYEGSLGGFSYIEFNPNTNTFSAPAAFFASVLGVAVDGNGNILTAKVNGGVSKFAPNGAVIWNAPGQPGTTETRGVQVDSNGDVWGIHRVSNNISKFRGSDGAPLGVFPIGNSPYTYSDATGISGFSTTNPTGNWRIIQDSGTPGHEWDKITWNTEPQASVPPGTSITVDARVAATEAGLAGQSFTPVTNGGALSLTGQFIEVRATLSSNDPDTSPVLSDLSITSEVTSTVCDIDVDGDVDSADLMLIRLANGQTPAPGDPKDANGDGKINVADARYCALRCTLPGCATGPGGGGAPPPPPPTR
jgi:hypothetical protein